MNIYDIIQELNIENGSNYKIKVLQKYKNFDELTRVLKMTYDRVQYNYGLGKTSLQKLPEREYNNNISSTEALNIIESELCTRNVTGNAAQDLVYEILCSLNEENAFIIEKVLERDLRINLGRTQINKVHKDLIIKPVYNRCDVYSSKTAKNIKFPAIVQLKADGTYREFNVSDGIVTCNSRSGESYDYPIINETLSTLPNGYYMGELTVRGIPDRSKGNGLINSDNPPHENIILEVWDYVTEEDYKLAGLKDKKNLPKIKYSERFKTLISIYNNSKLKNPELYINQNFALIDYEYVHTLKEALTYTSEKMSDGFEGAILKDLDMIFKDGTNKQQLKLKLEIDLEVRLVGFQDGTIGTKREGKVGSLIFANDEGTIKGRCSGFTDVELDEFTLNKDKYLNKILTVQFNDLTKAEGNDYYALSHPRFMEFRNDKDSTNTLEEAFQLKNMAMEIKG